VRALSEAVAAEETNILHQNVLGGTATRSAINCTSAAKTGTTSELVDAWLDGYTPNYSTVVWMGYPNKRVSMTSVHGQPQQGGYLPAEIWHQYMAAVTEGKPCVEFPQPKETISYQPFFGKLETLGQAESNAASEAGASEAHKHKKAGARNGAQPRKGGSPESGGSGAGAQSEPGEPTPPGGGHSGKGTGGAPAN
jgi:penicillin-binding protein 1A